MRLIDRITRWKPCPPAVEWLGNRDLETAWAECQRADWMLWLATSNVIPDSPLHVAVVRGACRCVEQEALPHAGDNAGVVENCISAGRAWADSPSDRTVADAYASYVAAVCATNAAYAAACVTNAAACAICAANACTFAAVVANVADGKGYADAHADAHARMADILREEITVDLVDAALSAAGR